MKMVISKILLLFILAGFCIFAGVSEPVRSSFSDSMFFFSVVAFFMAFVVYDLDKHTKSYEAAMKKFW